MNDIGLAETLSETWAGVRPMVGAPPAPRATLNRRQAFASFVTLGKEGGSATADAEAMGGLICLLLRACIPLTKVHRQLRGILSDRAAGLGPNRVLSVQALNR